MKPTNRKRGRPPKSVGSESGHRQKNICKFSDDLQMPTLPYSDQPRDVVDSVLVMYDALRRRREQLEETESEGHEQIHLKALSSMRKAKLFVNQEKRIGGVPGVEVGDVFYFRAEMCLVGLHSKVNEGIDYMSAAFDNTEDTVATCVVSSGVYDNGQDDPNILIYTGSGKDNKVAQKLKKGNLGLKGSSNRDTLIRVIRSAKGFLPRLQEKNKVYIYDGLYKITKSWTAKGASGFRIFKHRMIREPGQPDGFMVWKKTHKWRQDPSSRDHLLLLDISNGVEREKVCVVNEIDHEAAPGDFTYTNDLVNRNNQASLMCKMQGCCDCKDSCSQGAKKCSCLQPNGGELPYIHSGLLVSRKPVLYECTRSCTCSGDCRNRQVQRGSSLHFEVFKTVNIGWGLRSWDPIRAGAFICEYAGEITEKGEVCGEDDYLFEATRSGHNLSWNCVPELVGQPSLSDPNDTFKELPIVISAKQSGNVARFMNHSCSPNVFWQPVIYDEGHPHIAFFAIKHIPPMTELTFDYGDRRCETQQVSNSGCGRPKCCLCASQKCRGSFG